MFLSRQTEVSATRRERSAPRSGALDQGNHVPDMLVYILYVLLALFCWHFISHRR
jgi:hypothetical protein